uniref:Uncharacterized protein n=1 Tax=Ditylenchus dipsaci TaxID=166011 RepID=A0A915DKM7_9BILA
MLDSVAFPTLGQPFEISIHKKIMLPFGNFLICHLQYFRQRSRIIMDNSYLSGISDQGNIVEVLVHYKLGEKNQEAVLKIKNNLTFVEFGSKIVETFWSKIMDGGVKSFSISKFYTKFNRNVLLRNSSSDFLEDGFEFKVDHASGEEQETTFWVKSIEVERDQMATARKSFTNSSKPAVPSLLSYDCGQLNWHKEANNCQLGGFAKNFGLSLPVESDSSGQIIDSDNFFLEFPSEAQGLDATVAENNNSSKVQLNKSFPGKQSSKRRAYVDLDKPLTEDSDLSFVCAEPRDTTFLMELHNSSRPLVSEKSIQEVRDHLEAPFCRRFLLPSPISQVLNVAEEIVEESVPVLDQKDAEEKVEELLKVCRTERDSDEQSNLVRKILNLLQGLGDPFELIKREFDVKMIERKITYDTEFANSFSKFWAPAMLDWYANNREDYDVDLKDLISSEELSMRALKLLCAFTEPSSFIGGFFCKAESEDMMNKILTKSQMGCAKIVDFQSNYFLAFCGKKIGLKGGLADAISFYCMIHSFFGYRFQNKNSQQLMYGVAVLLGLPLPTFCEFSERLKQMLQGSYKIIHARLLEEKVCQKVVRNSSGLLKLLGISQAVVLNVYL